MPPLHTVSPSHPRLPSRSLRTLCRAMEYARAAMPVYGVQRALFDGLSMVRVAAHPTQLAAQPSRGFKPGSRQQPCGPHISRNLT